MFSVLNTCKVPLTLQQDFAGVGAEFDSSQRSVDVLSKRHRKNQCKDRVFRVKRVFNSSKHSRKTFSIRIAYSPQVPSEASSETRRSTRLQVLGHRRRLR